MEQKPDNLEIPTYIKVLSDKYRDGTITDSEQEILDNWIIEGNARKFIKYLVYSDGDKKKNGIKKRIKYLFKS